LNTIKYIFKATTIFLAICLLTGRVLLAKEADAYTASEDEAHISVDASREIGPLPYIFRTGVFFAHSPEFPPDLPIARRFFKDQKTGSIEIQKPFLSPQLFPPGSTLEGYPERLSKSDTVRWIKEIHKNGGEIIFNLMGMPNHLRAVKADGHSRPYDYERWAELVQATVDYINNTLHIDAKYILWDEPELFYNGAEEDYLKLYKYSVLGAKRADRNAKVGGPAASTVNAAFKDKKTPLIHNFIQYCSKTSLPEVGLDRLPIDFLVWHDFGFITSKRMKQEAPLVRKWLKDYRYDEDTTLINGSWNSWRDFPKSGSRERDTEYLASYILPAVLAMDEAGIQRHTFFSLFENWQIGEGTSIYGREILQDVIDNKLEYFGGFGLITKSYIVKPVYNAFKAISMLEGDKVEASSNDPLVSVIGSRDGKKMFLLFSNFIPDDRQVIRQAMKSLTEKVYKKSDLKRYGLTTKKMKGILAGEVAVDELTIPPGVKDDLKEAVAFLKEADKRRNNPVTVKINFENLPFNGNIKYERYLIDPDHSNSYLLRSKVEAAINIARKMAEEEAYNYLSEKWDKEDVQHIQNLKNKGVNPRKIIKQLPLDKKADMKAAIHLGEKILHEKIDEINEWPEVRLQKVEEKIIQTTGDYQETQVIKPYSVNLIILSK